MAGESYPQHSEGDTVCPCTMHCLPGLLSMLGHPNFETTHARPITVHFHFSRFTFNNLNIYKSHLLGHVANATRLAWVKNINRSGPGPGRAAAASKVPLGPL